MSYPYYGIDDEMVDRKGGTKMVEELIYCLKKYDTKKELAKALEDAGFVLPKNITENTNE